MAALIAFVLVGLLVVLHLVVMLAAACIAQAILAACGVAVNFWLCFGAIWLLRFILSAARGHNTSNSKG